jgi:ABC-type sugar transport system ATPase subunit
MKTEDNLFEIKSLCKNYPGVSALINVDLKIKRNTVHCVVGENGAGKSTFIKILTCVEEPTSGEIFYNGRNYQARTIREAMNMGISTIFQELNVVDQLTVEENLTLGKEKAKYGIIRKTERSDKIFNVLKNFAPDISLRQKVSRLSYAEKQVVEIVKAVGVDANLIIMDEPTAALSEQESKRLFTIIKNLKKQNVTVIYISHILNEIFAIGDYVTVFRDGKVIGTEIVENMTTEALIRMMVGKTVIENYTSREIDLTTKVLKVYDLCTEKLKNINFDLYKGEIIGFYGLRGSGKSEIAQALFGLDTLIEGKIEVDGKISNFRIPKNAMRNGITMVPEERLTEGLIMKLPIRSNISITNLKKISKLLVVDAKKERDIAEQYVKKINIKARSIEQKAKTLSGGNQQKVVVSKCLNADSQILLMDEPTRGIDVGAKEEIHKLIRALATEGASIVIFSSEYPEIINLCDRIFLLWEGEIVKVINNRDANAEEILHIISRGKKRSKHEDSSER